VHEARWLGALEEDEILVLPHRDESDEIQLVPECIQLASFALIEDQIAQRRVVAEIAHHQVEAGCQRPPLAGGVGIEVGTTVGNDERFRKYRTESLQRAAQLGGLDVRFLHREQLHQSRVHALRLFGQLAEIGVHVARITSMPARQLTISPQDERLTAVGDALDL